MKITSSTSTQDDEVAKLVAIVEHMMKARDIDARLDKAIDRTNLLEETLHISSLYTNKTRNNEMFSRRSKYLSRIVLNREEISTKR